MHRKLLRHFKFCIGILGKLILALVVCIAILVTLIRTPMARSFIEKVLTQYTGHSVYVAALDVGWSEHEPMLLAQQIQIRPTEGSALALKIPRLELHPDFKASLAARSVQLKTVSIVGLELHLASIFGALNKQEALGENHAITSIMLAWGLNQPEVVLRRSTLIYQLAESKTIKLKVPLLRFHKDAGVHKLTAVMVLEPILQRKANSIVSGRGRFTVHATWAQLYHISAKLNLDFSKFLLSGVSRSTWITDLAATGRAELKNGQLTASFEDIQANLPVWKTHFSNLTGQLKMDQSKGTFHLSQGEVRQSDQLNLKDLLGDFAWTKNRAKHSPGWDIVLHQLSARSKTQQIKASAQWHLSQQLHPLSWHMMVGVDKMPLVELLKQNLPISLSARSWLTKSVQSGEIHALQFDFSKKPAQENTTFHLNAKLQDVTVHFAKHWPVLNLDHAILGVDQNGLNLQAQALHYSGTKLDVGQITILGTQTPHMQIHARQSGELMQQLNLLPPVKMKTMWAHIQPKLNISGRSVIDFYLDMPLNAPDTFKTYLMVHLKQVDIGPKASTLGLKKINGEVRFQDGQLSAKALKATLLKAPVQIQIVTDAKKQVQVSLKGQMSVQALAPYLQGGFGERLLEDLKGSTPYQLKLLAGPKMDAHLELMTDLQGVESRLPAPFAKKQGVKERLTINWPVAHPLQSIQASFQDAKLLIQQKEQRISTAVHGKFDRLDFDAWAEKMRDSGHGASLNSWLKLDVQAKALLLFGQTYREVDVLANVHPKASELTLAGPKINGRLDVSMLKDGYALQIGMNRLVWTKKKQHSDGLSAYASQMKLQKFPESLRIHCAACQFGLKARPFALNLDMHKLYAHRMKLDDFELEQDSRVLSFAGDWEETTKGSQTRIDGRLSGNNLGGGLQAWNLLDVLDGGAGSLRFQLAWPAGPLSPTLEMLHGRIGMDLSRGRILRIGSGVEAKLKQVRALNFFSPIEMLRHVATSFKDLGENGYHFDTLKSHIEIKDHALVIQEMKAAGPAVDMEMAGGVNLGRREYDLVVRAKPHVTSSLPVVATLAGGVVVGAAAWLADHLMGSRVGEEMSHAYRVTGPWDHPIVKKVD